tara:strand:+ start:197 stop:379 length:183 start_codon:yes stop_codon:yes gene_type:complete
VQVGDLVRWNGGDGDDGIVGLVVRIARTGGDRLLSAKVVFVDGYEGWHGTKKLEVLGERG